MDENREDYEYKKGVIGIYSPIHWELLSLDALTNEFQLIQQNFNMFDCFYLYQKHQKISADNSNIFAMLLYHQPVSEQTALTEVLNNLNKYKRQVEESSIITTDTGNTKISIN